MVERLFPGSTHHPTISGNDLTAVLTMQAGARDMSVLLNGDNKVGQLCFDNSGIANIDRGILGVNIVEGVMTWAKVTSLVCRF